MYSACKLNKQRDNIQPWCTPFPIPSLLWVKPEVPAWPSTSIFQPQHYWHFGQTSFWCRGSPEHARCLAASQASTHQRQNANMTSAPTVTTKKICTHGPVSLGGRNYPQLRTTGPHDSVWTISHSASLTPDQPHWGIFFFFIWLFFEHMEHAPTSGPLQSFFSWPGMLILLRDPWLYGFLPAFFWVSVQMSLNGEVFCYHPMLWLPWGFPGGSDSKEPTCDAGDMIPRLGRSLGDGNGYPL